jgi:type III secretion system FlhB-like substrate exporter
VGAVAAAATVIASLAMTGALAHRLGAALAAACSQRAVLEPAALPETVAEITLSIVGAAAVAALIAQLAQTRTAWLPRRRIAGAPTVETGPWPRTRRAAGELCAAAAIGGLTFAWLWWAAPHLAVLAMVDPTLGSTLDPAAADIGRRGTRLWAGAATLLANLGISVVIAWFVLGILDTLARHVAVARALHMTSADKREDDRLAGADPRWRAHRARVQRSPDASDAVAGASVVILGDDMAIAVAWDPIRRPIPIRTVTGRGPRAIQLVGLARRHQIAVHRDPALAAALVAGDGPVPEPHWPHLAEIIAATRSRDRTARQTL